ncbi:MAG: phosphohistidine phosphatase SixA [bacterium]
MRLYLLRHGEAASSDENPQRPLTHAGRKDTEKIARFIGKQRLHVRAIEHSGKLRAQQTAGIVASAVESEKDVAKADGLLPDDDVETRARELSHVDGDIMLVGHLPFLSKLASRLLTGDETQAIVNFKPSSLLCLERTDEGTWRVSFLITPDSI